MRHTHHPEYADILDQVAVALTIYRRAESPDRQRLAAPKFTPEN
jgi:hypothetical protein